MRIRFLDGKFREIPELSEANLSGADLSGANLSEADLSGANLSRANLSRADLSGANLSRANLSGADLSRANLSGANLSGADLSRANLSVADLSRANLSRANLSEADLRWADLRGADLSGAIGLGAFVRAPAGELVVYKKLRGGVVATLKIMYEFKRVNAIGSNKCRSDRALVLALSGGITSGQSIHDPSFVYTVGEIVECSEFEPSDRIECGGGIHWFITKQEAEEYT